jgi:hypothetical protein
MRRELLRDTFRIFIAGLAALAFMTCAAVTLSGPALAQAPIKQIKLTEKQVQGFIAAQKDMNAMADKLEGAAGDSPDPAVQAELEAVAKKNGFADFAEYDDVAVNISIVLGGLDPQTKVFTEPQAAITKEIADVTADKTIADAEKKQILEELNEALKFAEPVQYKENIELVTKYADQFETTQQ